MIHPRYLHAYLSSAEIAEWHAYLKMKAEDERSAQARAEATTRMRRRGR